MVRLPRNISPAARARRILLADVAIAICLALLAILLAAGIGVVGFGAALLLVALTAWICLEALIRLLMRRRHLGAGGNQSPDRIG